MPMRRSLSTVYIHRLVAAIAAMAAATGGLDALVFTGGVGEHSATVRRLAVEKLAFLGVTIDPSRNTEVVDGDTDITAEGQRHPNPRHYRPGGPADRATKSGPYWRPPEAGVSPTSALASPEP